MGIIGDSKDLITICKENKEPIKKILNYLKTHILLSVIITTFVLALIIGAILFILNINVDISQVSINYKEITLNINETAELNATVLLSNNKTYNKIVWSSNNPDVVSVDKFGKITAHKKGTAEITAQASRFGKSAADVCTVNVNTAPTGYSILLSTNEALTTEIVKVYVTTFPEDKVTNITIYAIAPSGEEFIRKLSDSGYYFYTETGTWKIYAMIENEEGNYIGTKPEEIAYLEVSGKTYNSLNEFSGQLLTQENDLFSGIFDW